MSQDLGIEVRLTCSHAEAIDRVTVALKAEGFGVLTRVDIDKAFKDKIGADFRPYTILGACNPGLAHTALTSKPEIGLMLPCNVTVESAEDDNGCLVRITDPKSMMQMGSLGAEESIQSVARDASDRLGRVAEYLNAGA